MIGHELIEGGRLEDAIAWLFGDARATYGSAPNSSVSNLPKAVNSINPVLCKRLAHFRSAPKATELLSYRDMTRSAKRRLRHGRKTKK